MKVDIRGRSFDVSGAFRDYAERRLEFGLGRLQHRIVRVRVWLTDLNGPRGGVDKRCRIEVVGRQATVAAEASSDNAYAAIDLAADRIRHVARRLAERDATIDRSRSFAW